MVNFIYLYVSLLLHSLNHNYYKIISTTCIYIMPILADLPGPSGLFNMYVHYNAPVSGIGDISK